MASFKYQPEELEWALRDAQEKDEIHESWASHIIDLFKGKPCTMDDIHDKLMHQAVNREINYNISTGIMIGNVLRPYEELVLERRKQS